MPRVLLMGWRKGVHVIRLVDVVRRYTGLGLYDAKTSVDRSLTGEVVVLDLPDAENARALAREAAAVGAVVELDLSEEGRDPHREQPENRPPSERQAS